MVVNEDDPAPTGSLSINDHLFEDYNEESDQDWASGGSESDSDSSLIDQDLLSHPAFQLDEESLGEVDVDGPEEEHQYEPGKFSLLLQLLLGDFLFSYFTAYTSYTEEEMEKLQDEVKEIGMVLSCMIATLRQY